MFLNPEFSGQENSAWSLINAMSNFEQWKAPVRKFSRDEVIAMRTIKGTQSPMTDKAYKMLVTS